MAAIDHTTCDAEMGSSGKYSLLPWRRAALVTLLVAEAIVRSIRFDTGAIYDVNAEWAVLLGRAPLVGHLAISIGVALLIFGGDRLRQNARRRAGQVDGAPFRWTLLFAHLLLIAVFYQLLTIVFEGNI